MAISFVFTGRADNKLLCLFHSRRLACSEWLFPASFIDDIGVKAGKSPLMIELFSDEVRRDPYPMYAKMRSASPVFHAPPPFDMWMIFDYQGAKKALNDHE